MKLDSFLKLHRLTQTAFAERVGVSQATVSQYVTGARRPTWPVLEKIEDATQGQVTPNDFMGGAATPPPDAA